MASLKLSDSSIQLEKIIPQEVKSVSYERTFIEQQIKNITFQRNEMIAAKEAELAECQAILAEMDKVGVLTEGVVDVGVGIKG